MNDYLFVCSRSALQPKWPYEQQLEPQQTQQAPDPQSHAVREKIDSAIISRRYKSSVSAPQSLIHVSYQRLDE